MTEKEFWREAVRVWRCGAEALEKLPETVSAVAFSDTVRAIAECRGKVICAGVGTSGAAAKKIAHSLSCIERPAFFLDPGDAVHGALGSVQPGDVAILISKGGNTSEIISLIPALQNKTVTIIGVTESKESVLAEACTILLQIAVNKEADRFNMLATTSTMAVTAVFDAVCIVLMGHTGFTREKFAIIHPGGAVGSRLLSGKE